MASNDEFDPQLLAARLGANRTSRRRFLGQGRRRGGPRSRPSFLAACGSKDSGGGGTTATATTADDGAKASGHLRISNWPLYMADGFVAGFQTASGLTVDYRRTSTTTRMVRQNRSRCRASRTSAPIWWCHPVHGVAAQATRLAQRDQRNPVANRKNLRPDLLNDASIRAASTRRPT